MFDILSIYSWIIMYCDNLNDDTTCQRGHDKSKFCFAGHQSKECQGSKGLDSGRLSSSRRETSDTV